MDSKTPEPLNMFKIKGLVFRAVLLVTSSIGFSFLHVAMINGRCLAC
jgi:hypothetical protein